MTRTPTARRPAAAASSPAAGPSHLATMTAAERCPDAAIGAENSR